MTFLPCKIFPGAFSGEFAFQIKLADGTTHDGLAAREYVLTKEQKRIENPSSKGTDGLVVARLLKREGADLFVSVPDGEVLKINQTQIISIPRLETSPNVPIGS